MPKQGLCQIAEKISAPLEAVASSERVAILLAIGNGEACVCHLVSVLGWRQAYVSQQLMALRKADILTDRREGRYVFYRLTDSSILAVLAAAAAVSGLSADAVYASSEYPADSSCECPHCLPSAAKGSLFRLT